MFIQVINGKTNDPKGLRTRLDSWETEVGPGAGYLGVTGGIAEDGTVIMLARFADEAAATANSNRAEQSTWWNETEKYFDGDVAFRNCTEVELTLDGGSDSAGFVQVMQGRVANKARLRELEAEFMPQLETMRKDVIGSVRAWDGDDFTEAIYFTTEADARAGEAKMAADEGPGPNMEEFQALMQDLVYIDLKDPLLRSA